MIYTDKKDIEEQFKKRGVKNECPFCGSVNTFVVNEKMGANVPVDKQGAFEFIPKQTFATFQIVCPNCGYVAEFINVK